MLKGYLRLAQYFRDVPSILVWIFYVPKDHDVVKAMEAEGQSYDTDVKKRGRGHGQGPPSIHVARALMNALVKIGEKIGANAYKCITAYLLEYDQLTVVE